MRRRIGVRFHEGVFAITALGCLIALVLHGDAASLLAGQIAVCLLVYIAAILSLAGRASLKAERLRLLANFAFNSWFYGVTSQVSLALHAAPFDWPLRRIDEQLCGEMPAVAMQRIQSPGLTDVMSFCYLFYLPYLFLVLFWGLRQSAKVIRQYSGLYFANASLGFATYLLIPAKGPAHAFPSLFSKPLEGGFITVLNHQVMSRSSAIYGTFPSLHVLMTLVLLHGDWRECRRRFWLLLAPSIGLFLSTIYLRYHYLADVLAAGVYFLVTLAFFRAGAKAGEGAADA